MFSKVPFQHSLFFCTPATGARNVHNYKLCVSSRILRVQQKSSKIVYIRIHIFGLTYLEIGIFLWKTNEKEEWDMLQNLIAITNYPSFMKNIIWFHLVTKTAWVHLFFNPPQIPIPRKQVHNTILQLSFRGDPKTRDVNRR